MREIDYDHTVPRRSDGTRQTQRPMNPWPARTPFRLLSIDGGGVRGLLPALVLTELEKRFLNGAPIGNQFDMIVGTSTGGIIALGLGQGLTASEIANLYLERGERIFPVPNAAVRAWRTATGWFGTTHDRTALEAELRRVFQDALFENSSVPLCVPAFEGRYSEPYIFKTPHHADYKRDGRERLVDVALATAAAPTVFNAIDRDGYTFVDGGVWANNPVMVGIVDALTCFAIDRRQLHVLSLGTGRPRVRISSRTKSGGRLHWAKHFYMAATAAQSHNALGQAYLLLGRDRVTRLDGPESLELIDMSDIRRAVRELPGVARAIVDASGRDVANEFFDSNQKEGRPLVAAE